MDLTADTVRHLAQLARLRPSTEEEARLLQDLGEILDFFAALGQADLEGVEPLAHPFEVTQRLREDVVTETDRRKDYQRLAPDTRGGLYRVPAVLGSD